MYAGPCSVSAAGHCTKTPLSLKTRRTSNPRASWPARPRIRPGTSRLPAHSRSAFDSRLVRKSLNNALHLTRTSRVGRLGRWTSGKNARHDTPAGQGSGEYSYQSSRIFSAFPRGRGIMLSIESACRHVRVRHDGTLGSSRLTASRRRRPRQTARDTETQSPSACR